MERMSVSVQPEWCRRLPVQQQSVLFLAGRGPDGMPKHHPCKAVHVAYRGSVFVAAKYGRPLWWGERADSFMSLERFADNELWSLDVQSFFDYHDQLPKHYLVHLMHGAEILGYKHHDDRYRRRWIDFYGQCVDMFHLRPESEADMDKRLGDWDRKFWNEDEDEERPPPQAVAQGGLTHEQMAQACKNIGYDLTCGQCASVFYTGVGIYQHDETCTTAVGRR